MHRPVPKKRDANISGLDAGREQRCATPRGGLRRQRHEPAAWTDDAGQEPWPFAVRDGHVEAYERANAPQLGVVGSREFEEEDFAAWGRVGRRMDSVGAPFDKEGKEASLVVAETEGFPSQDTAVRTLALARRRPVEGNAGSAEAARDDVEVARMRGPAHEARHCELLKAIRVRRAWLGWVGGDDFEIVLFPERNQRVARSAPRMDAAVSWSDTRMLLDERDASIEVARAEQDVVEGSGHVNSPGNGGRGGCAAGQGEKQSAR